MINFPGHFFNCLLPNQKAHEPAQCPLVWRIDEHHRADEQLSGNVPHEVL